MMAVQYGMVSRTQAFSAGMTQHQIRARVRTGKWVRTVPGVYQNAAVPYTPHAGLLAACMAYDALASHRSAAALLGIDGYRLDRVEITVASTGVRRIPRVRLHHSTQMDLTRPVIRDKIRCTGPARTVLDLASVVPRKQLDRTINAVLRAKQLRLSDLWAVLASHTKPGRNGCTALRSALEARCTEGGIPLSDWSRMAADLLVDARLPRPVFEYQIIDKDDSLVAQVDLAYPDERLAIELDSVRWHLNVESFVEDPRRRNATQLAGWTVLSFTWDDYAKHPNDLCAAVARALHQRATRAT